jgi:hypothetical protein
MEWKTLGGNCFRSCHHAVFYKGSVFLFLGEKREEYLFSSDVVQYTPSTQELVVHEGNHSSPIARRNHVVIRRGRYAYLFGGDYHRINDLNETYRYSTIY